MKKIFITLFLLTILIACGNEVDNQSLENISDGLESRWGFTDSLGEDISVKDLEEATQKELDFIEKYDADQFRDASLYILYDNYRRELEDGLFKLDNLDISTKESEIQWNEHVEKRSKILYDITTNYDLDVSEKYNDVFKEVLDASKTLVQEDDIKEVLSKVNELDEIEVEVEEDSVSVSFLTESSLNAKSFVGSKTGFPSNAIEILEALTEYDYEDIVISTTNQDSIAISSYFGKKSLSNINFDKWKDMDSIDAYKFYSMADAYHIRLGIWESLDDDIKQSIGDMNKDNSNEFWKEYGFTH